MIGISVFRVLVLIAIYLLLIAGTMAVGSVLPTLANPVVRTVCAGLLVAVIAIATGWLGRQAGLSQGKVLVFALFGIVNVLFAAAGISIALEGKVSEGAAVLVWQLLTPVFFLNRWLAEVGFGVLPWRRETAVALS